ncbi:MAG: hypothetical protein ACI9LO_002153 [Planctomycetota bacterium]|jgi:hypothetical protein
MFVKTECLEFIHFPDNPNSENMIDLKYRLKGLYLVLLKDLIYEREIYHEQVIQGYGY